MVLSDIFLTHRGIPVIRKRKDDHGNYIYTITEDWQIIITWNGDLIVTQCGVAKLSKCTADDAAAYLKGKLDIQ